MGQDATMIRDAVLQAHVAASLGRITPTTDLAELASCDLLIEAVIEDIGLKERL